MNSFCDFDKAGGRVLRLNVQHNFDNLKLTSEVLNLDLNLNSAINYHPVVLHAANQCVCMDGRQARKP